MPFVISLNHALRDLATPLPLTDLVRRSGLRTDGGVAKEPLQYAHLGAVGAVEGFEGEVVVAPPGAAGPEGPALPRGLVLAQIGQQRG